MSDDPPMDELVAKMSKQLVLGIPSIPGSLISTQIELEEQLPIMCSSIFETLTSRQLEATYQRCLHIDLEEAGVEVHPEISMKLTYKGRVVGTRRADLILRTKGDGVTLVVELKAVSNLTTEHLKQLEYYMYHFDIENGYLINFPHDAGFPSVISGSGGGSGSDSGSGSGSGSSVVFQQTVLQGSCGILSDRSIRDRHADSTVQIIKVKRNRSSSSSSSGSGGGGGATAAATIFQGSVGDSRTQASVPAPPSSSSSSSSSNRRLGVTQKGTPCKICLNMGSFCRLHKDQEHR